MCGRYSLSDPSLIWEAFDIDISNNPTIKERLKPRYNIAPSQWVPVVVQEEGQNSLLLYRWGFMPGWSKKRIINARAETVDKKPSFKQNLLYRRCLVPADGYYEWKKKGGRKRPYRITDRDGSLFAFAGLWGDEEGGEGKEGDDNRKDAGFLQHENKGNEASFAIITTAASPALAAIHDRMPVILAGEAARAWLDGSVRNPGELKELLRPFPGANLSYYEVSTAVNSPANDSPSCLEPVNAANRESE